jgi:RHS repeat-associated protein
VLASYAWTYSSDGSPLLSGEGQGEGAFVWSPSGGIVPVHDTTGVTAALSSGGFAGLAEVTSCTSTDGMTSYSYDPTGELLAATYTGGQAAESYTYDANGNRVTANGYVYASGADNRLLSDGTYTYAYDGEGNRTEKFIDANHDGVLDAGDTDVTQFTWDNRDRLTEVKTYATEGGDPTEVVDYLYDVENRWIGENIYSPLPSGEGQGEGFTEHQIRFAYDGNQIVLQFDKDGSGQLDASNLSHRYTWLPNAVDQLMSDEQVSTPAQAGQVVWTLGDNQGTIKDLAVMDSGVTSVVNHRVFDSYGNLVSQTNSAVDCLFGYTGRAKDNVTGLQNNLNRWYDSRVAGWLSQDPTGFLAGQTNLYVYCGNSPLTFVDPRGLEATTIGGAMIAAWVYTQAAAAATGAAIVAGETAAIAGCAYGGYKAGEALSTITTVPLVNWYYSDSAEPASEKTAKDMARQIERDLGPEARDKFHDLKGAGEPDRTLEELKDDAQRIYEEYGRTPPKWMQ